MLISADDIKYYHLKQPELYAAIKNFETRCKATTNIKFSWHPAEDIEDDDGAYTRANVNISITSGGKSKEIFLPTYADVLDFSEVDFEKYVFLEDYAAIFSASEGSIEAILSAPTHKSSSSSVNDIRELLGLSDLPGSRPRPRLRRDPLSLRPLENRKLPTEILLQSNLTNNPSIKIQDTSEVAKLITQTSEKLNLSIVIKTPIKSDYNKALNLLKKISNALFFEIGFQKEVHLELMRLDPQKDKIQSTINNQQGIVYPEKMYDEAPIDLYRYAHSATNTPLLQFLAYYQVIEFYFPRFFKSSCIRRIRSAIKDPSLQVENDADLYRVISKIYTKNYNSEKNQLNATLEECLGNRDIQEFLTETKERTEFFKSKEKDITSNTLNIKDKSIDLYTQVANRIYDIRCKIVHTKNDGNQKEIESLLPYSPGAGKLGNDIELVRHAARKVLIYTSIEFDIKI